MQLLISSTVEIIVYKIRIKRIKGTLDENKNLLGISNRNNFGKFLLKYIKSHFIIFIQEIIELWNNLLIKLRKKSCQQISIIDM
ncbi:MAG: hypothetical protein WCG98_09125 [bacterium]